MSLGMRTDKFEQSHPRLSNGGDVRGLGSGDGQESHGPRMTWAAR